MPDNFLDFTAQFRLTNAAQASLEHAKMLAQSGARADDSYVGTEHVLLGVLAQDSSLGARILAEYGVTLERAQSVLDLTMRRITIATIQHGVHTDVLEMLRLAAALTQEFGQARIGTEHIIYSILVQRNARATQLLNDMNIDISDIRAELEDMFMRQETDAKTRLSHAKTPASGAHALTKYGVDLTERARSGALDAVYGREEQLQRVMAILGRKQKNNPILVGEAGVGKTAIVEGLAQRIAQGNVPRFLRDGRIFQIDLSQVVAGAKYRGEFEERVQKILAVAERQREVILFIDEIHLLVGAGSSEGSMDAANILKPALARGSVQVIGATTFDEYRKYIEKDKALSRRLQKVIVPEPDAQSARAMLEVASQSLARHHHITINPEIFDEVISLSNTYIAERHLPDKAIDILDEAAALFRSEQSDDYMKKQLLGKRLQQLAKKVDTAVEAENYAAAAQVKARMATLERQVQKMRDETMELPREYVYRAVALTAGVPLSSVRPETAWTAKELQRRIEASIFGQHHATENISRILARAMMKLKPVKGPIASLLFFGTTGVGKTEMARVIARDIIGDEQKFIKIDMSEFSEKHTSSRLVGSPAGYVGYDDVPLFDQIRRHPHSVVLFDEAEKAHPEIFHMLLQILEDGAITDAKGREISFRQTIIIVTTNLGAEILQGEKTLGFRHADDAAATQITHKNNAEKKLKEHFRPEFIERFDGIIPFYPLSALAIERILAQYLKHTRAALKKRGLTFHMSTSVKNQILAAAEYEKQGARMVYRVADAHVLDPLGDFLAAHDAPENSVLQITQKKNGVHINVKSS